MSTQLQTTAKVPFLKRKWVKWSGLALLAILIIIGIVAAVKAYKRSKEKKELEKAGADTGKQNTEHKAPSGKNPGSKSHQEKPPAAPPPPNAPPPQPPPRMNSVSYDKLKIGNTIVAATDTALYDKQPGTPGATALATIPAGSYVGTITSLNPLMIQNWKVKDPNYSEFWGGSQYLAQTKFYIPLKNYVVQ